VPAPTVDWDSDDMFDEFAEKFICQVCWMIYQLKLSSFVIPHMSDVAVYGTASENKKIHCETVDYVPDHVSSRGEGHKKPAPIHVSLAETCHKNSTAY
jgi:hypothetical protein